MVLVLVLVLGVVDLVVLGTVVECSVVVVGEGPLVLTKEAVEAP